MADYIPHELLVEILKKLPVNSLLRFKSVCKSWYSLITNPSFIAAHLNHQTIQSIKKNNRTFLFVYFDIVERKYHYTLCREDESFGEQYTQLDFAFNCSNSHYGIVGSCNGLICLYFFRNVENIILWNPSIRNVENIILWNPSIRKSEILPLPRMVTSPYAIVLGFGVCPVTHDPKVVRMTYTVDQSRRNKCSPDVEIFRVSTGTWRRTGSAVPHYIHAVENPQAFVNGAVHWIANHKQKEGGIRCLIVSFDMHYEVFHEIVPPNSVGETVVSSTVAVLGESLAMIKYNETMSCSIWVMKEYGVAESWTKLLTIDLRGAVRKIVGFWKNGEIIMLSNKKLVSYHPNTEKTKNLDIHTGMHSIFVDTYMETLLLPKGPRRPCQTVIPL